MTRSYWFASFNPETWDEFLAHGGDVVGFSERRRVSVDRIRPGDYLLSYLIQVSRFVGLLEAVGEPFFDTQEIWKSRTYPIRVPVRTILALGVQQGIPMQKVRKKLSIFRGLDNPSYWSTRIQTSPTRWSAEDAEVIVTALKEAGEGQTS